MLCSNEACGMEINKQERVHHETAVCEYRNRRVKCHDCGQIQEVVGRLEGSVRELNEKVEGGNEKLDAVNAKVDAVNQKVDGVNENVGWCV